jgi:shikimate dehydrogenase
VPEDKRLQLAATARTRVAGVIGDPIRHSLSPALHNAAYAALGLDWVYVAFPVTAGGGAAAVEAMRTLGLAGLSVTMPHKQSAAAAVDRLTPTAARLGVVNTVSWSTVSEGELVGDSTDGPGFIDNLRGDEGFDPAGCRAVVLGTGGAARSVTLALAEARTGSVVVVGRDPKAAEACAGLAAPSGAAAAPADLDPVVGSADLVVNATPVGMAPGDGLPFGIGPDSLASCRFVADLIYAPARTPLLMAARERGVATGNGLGMLIHQAARQIEMWTGRPAPLDTMSAAALAALAHSVD